MRRTLANERTRPAQDLNDTIYQFLELRLGRAAVRDEDGVDAWRYRSAQGTYSLPQPALRAVAFHGTSGPARDGNADTGRALLAGLPHVRRDRGRRSLLAF